jgi:hypothetical protein
MSESISEENLTHFEFVYGPVDAHFLITKTPQGDAPENIREQWIDLSLPVRRANLGQIAMQARGTETGILREVQNSVPVLGLEAVHALLIAGREEAAKYWAPLQFGLFVFRAHEGRLEPVSES